jgi:hypothetical protein
MVKKETKPDVATTFSLAGAVWTVEFVTYLDDMGKCDAEKQAISIRSGMNRQATEQTFYHELVHAIMFTMGKVNHDEEFTDAFGALLHQYQRTKVV